MNDIDVLLEKLKGIETLFNQRFDENEKQHNRIFKILEGKADKKELDKKANKMVETIVYGGVKLVLVAVVGALLGIIVVKPAFALNLFSKFT